MIRLYAKPSRKSTVVRFARSITILLIVSSLTVWSLLRGGCMPDMARSISHRTLISSLFSSPMSSYRLLVGTTARHVTLDCVDVFFPTRKWFRTNPELASPPPTWRERLQYRLREKKTPVRKVAAFRSKVPRRYRSAPPINAPGCACTRSAQGEIGNLRTSRSETLPRTISSTRSRSRWGRISGSKRYLRLYQPVVALACFTRH